MSLQEQIQAIQNKISGLEKEKIRSAEVQARQAQGFKVTGVNFTQGNLNRQIAKLQTQLDNLISNPPQLDIPVNEITEPMTAEKQQQNFSLGSLAIIGGAILLLS